MSPLLVIVAATIALVGFALGATVGRGRTESGRRRARPVWRGPEAKKDRARLQKLAKRNAKKINRAVHR